MNPYFRKLTDSQRMALKSYILRTIGDIDENTTDLNDKEKIEYVWNRFVQEKDGAAKSHNKRNLLIEWFSGLPSAFPIECYNSDIYSIGVEIGYLNSLSDVETVDDFIDSWFTIIADLFLDLKNGY